jgi:hypothetical protein
MESKQFSQQVSFSNKRQAKANLKHSMSQPRHYDEIENQDVQEGDQELLVDESGMHF